MRPQRPSHSHPDIAALPDIRPLTRHAADSHDFQRSVNAHLFLADPAAPPSNFPPLVGAFSPPLPTAFQHPQRFAPFFP